MKTGDHEFIRHELFDPYRVGVFCHVSHRVAPDAINFVPYRDGLICKIAGFLSVVAETGNKFLILRVV